MTVEEVYTNSFDATYVAWVEVGNSPYLHNTDTDYIYQVSARLVAYNEGCWSFPASAGSGTINSVKLRLEARRSNVSGDASIAVYVWDGSSWVNVGSISPSSTSYEWFEFDVSSTLNTWDKINGAKVYVMLSRYGAQSDTLYIRRLTRKVDYTAGLPTVSKIISSFSNIRTLTSKISTIFHSLKVSELSILSVNANPSQVPRNYGSSTVTCIWSDCIDLSICNYEAEIWLRNSVPNTYGPYYGTIEKLGEGSFSVTYTFTPDMSFPLGSYDVKCIIKRIG